MYNDDDDDDDDDDNDDDDLCNPIKNIVNIFLLNSLCVQCQNGGHGQKANSN